MYRSELQEDGTRLVTTTSESVAHFPYPCPPSRGHGSCQDAWKRNAKGWGIKVPSEETHATYR